MQTEVIEVQGPVSRPDSVRQRLGSAAWGAGTSAFVANGVPFSFTTGPELAARVCDLVVFLDEATPGRSLTIHDVGAGTGYLTRHVIEALATHDRGLARRCRYVASDNSAGMIDAMSEVLAALPQGVEDRVTVRVGDALSPDDILEGSPSVVLMSYLLDAVPPVHVALTDNTVNEIYAQTYVVADQPVVDGSTWPPRILEGEALVEVLGSSPESLSPGAVLQVLQLIVEAAVEGPALPGGARKSSAPFSNTRPGCVTAIREVIDRLDQESIVLITDFGFAGGQAPDSFDALMTEYGAAACYAVFFDELVEAFTSAGATCCVRPGEAGGTHTLAIYKGSRSAAFESMFETVFGEVDPDRKARMSLILGETSSPADVIQAEEQLKEMRERGERASYADLANLAHLSAAQGREDAARSYAENCDADYGLIAAPEQLLLGDLAAREGDTDAALVWYERARLIAPTYGATHVKCAEVFLSIGRFADYAETMKVYIGVTDEPVWAHLDWLGASGEQTLTSLPDEVREEFQQIRQAEFGT